MLSEVSDLVRTLFFAVWGKEMTSGIGLVMCKAKISDLRRYLDNFSGESDDNISLIAIKPNTNTAVTMHLPDNR